MVKRSVVTAVALLCVVAAASDFIAADRPVVVRYRGRTYWLANLIDYAPLQGLSGTRMSSALGADDWALWPPVRSGPETVRTDGRLQPLSSPTAAHWLGTDDRGRDVLARLVHGARTSCSLALLCALFAGLGGWLLAAAGTLFARIEGPIGVMVDAVASLPVLLFVVAVQGLWGQISLAGAALLISLPHAASCARVTRAAMRQAAREAFVVAARATGAGRWRLWWRHLVPFSWQPTWIASAVAAATAIVAEAGLSFVGFGAPPPTASWGEILRQAVEHDLRWWLAFPAGAMVSISAAVFLRLSRFTWRPEWTGTTSRCRPESRHR